MLPLSIPLFRLEDTGMGLQMQEYAVSRVLHWFRRFDDYQALKLQSRWQPLPEYRREDFYYRHYGGRGVGRQSRGKPVALGFPSALLEP